MVGFGNIEKKTIQILYIPKNGMTTSCFDFENKFTFKFFLM
jgi:hypothetical protein